MNVILNAIPTVGFSRDLDYIEHGNIGHGRKRMKREGRTLSLPQMAAAGMLSLSPVPSLPWLGVLVLEGLNEAGSLY